MSISRLRQRTFTIMALTLFGSATLSSALYAAEAPPADQATTAEVESVADKPNNDETKKAAEKPAARSEVFIPTEEISEDFAVSFPVDI